MDLRQGNKNQYPDYLYLVYDNNGDWPVCVDATPQQAADLMGVTKGTLQKLVYWQKHGSRRSSRWTIMRRKPGEEYRLIEPEKKGASNE